MEALKSLVNLEPLMQSSLYGNNSLGVLLYGISCANHARAVLEIGYNRGYSAVFFCAGVLDGAEGGQKVVSLDIDPCDGGEVVRQQGERFAAIHQFIQGNSHEIAGSVMKGIGRPLDILFIDGDHSYEGTKADWVAYRSYLARDGIVLFHDADTEAVHRVIDEIPDYYFVKMGGWACLTMGRKMKYGQIGTAHT